MVDMTFDEILMPVTSTTMLATPFHAQIHDVITCQIGSKPWFLGPTRLRRVSLKTIKIQKDIHLFIKVGVVKR